MNTPAVAPGAAYLLTAAMAGNTQQAGAIAAGDDMSAEWGGYDEGARRDILAVLGEVIARALCSLQIQAYFRLGFTPVMIAARCRQSADEPQSSPHP